MSDIVEQTFFTDKIKAFKDFGNSLPLVENKPGNVGRAELRVEHHFSFGVYARTVYIPKDCALAGFVHKFENLNILLKGKLKVSVGEQIQIVEAPFTIVSPAGTERIAYALEDSIWMTVHGTHERDLDIIKDYFISETKEEYLEFIGSNQLHLPLTEL